jgi:hypothetical protein
MMNVTYVELLYINTEKGRKCDNSIVFAFFLSLDFHLFTS